MIFFASKHALGSELLAVDSNRCTASPIGEPFSAKHEVSSSTSELCFTRLEEINGTVEQFLLVNVSSSLPSDGTEDGVLSIPRNQLKTKHFLKPKPLLLFSEPHKRHSLAKLCQELVQSGFKSPKVLIGKRPGSLQQRRNSVVSATDYLEELSHFGAVTIASNTGVAKELATLGIPVVSDSSVDLKTTVRSALLSYSLNGYLPIFVIGEAGRDKPLQKNLQKIFDGEAFIVAGGVEAIKSTLRSGVLGAVKRAGLEGAPGCAN